MSALRPASRLPGKGLKHLLTNDHRNQGCHGGSYCRCRGCLTDGGKVDSRTKTNRRDERTRKSGLHGASIGGGKLFHAELESAVVLHPRQLQNTEHNLFELRGIQLVPGGRREVSDAHLNVLRRHTGWSKYRGRKLLIIEAG